MAISPCVILHTLKKIYSMFKLNIIVVINIEMIKLLKFKGTIF